MNMWVVQDVDNDGLIELVFNRISSLYVYDTITPAPTPRTLTQFNFFSQLRGRDPHYVPYGPLGTDRIKHLSSEWRNQCSL